MISYLSVNPARRTRVMVSRLRCPKTFDCGEGGTRLGGSRYNTSTGTVIPTISVSTVGVAVLWPRRECSLMGSAFRPVLCPALVVCARVVSALLVCLSALWPAWLRPRAPALWPALMKYTYMRIEQDCLHRLKRDTPVHKQLDHVESNLQGLQAGCRPLRHGNAMESPLPFSPVPQTLQNLRRHGYDALARGHFPRVHL
eukprot:3781651-Rhodomonas_salina.3